MATQITAIHYEMFVDMFTVDVSYNGKPAGVLEIHYRGSDDCSTRFKSFGPFHALPYGNASCLISDVLKAIADAQESQAAELPSDCTMPIDVPNRFTLLPA